MFLLNLSTKLSEITYLSKIKMIEDDLKQVIEEYYSTVNMSRKMQLENVLTDFKRNPLSIDLAKQMIVEVRSSGTGLNLVPILLLQTGNFSGHF